ncbi:MAG: HlyC/CorC family transporter [Candidatus Handelsmanbacteria bacterium]|nr:HlyC/CorC family transporter [Candidatus Handelsmanbacteria bacterium]
MGGFEFAVMAAMIGVNSVFAGYEIALASVSLARLQQLVQEQRAGAKVARYMKQNMEASLAVVQLGITLVGAIAAAVGGAGAEEMLAPALIGRLGVSEAVAEVLAIVLVVVPLTVCTIVVGELIPKVFALRNAERVCLTLSPFMRWFSLSVWPAVWLFETIVTGVMSWGERHLGAGEPAKTEMAELQEVRATAALARASRLIGHREEQIIVGATQLQSRVVRDIMLPAEHMGTLDANAALADNLIAAHLDMHTRFPVVEHQGEPQTVIGYVNFKDIAAAMRLNPQSADFRAIVRPILSLKDDQAIALALEQLMRERTHIALVRDAENRVVGMVTFEDIIEELVGEIEDEYDRLPAHLVASGTAWVAGGGVPIERLQAATGIDLNAEAPPSGIRTLSDWVSGHLGREVRGGDVVERGAVRVVVRKVLRKKVQEAHLSHRQEKQVADLKPRG